MRQFLEIKTKYPDGVLFFRMGDFYEMFFDDAVLAAKELDLTLTSRDRNREDAVPMAGVPHHAARGYIARLTELGHKVVICEQTEDPKKAKGLVRREVVQIVTPGIVVDDEALRPKEGRYLAALVHDKTQSAMGLAVLDVSTGDFRATQLDSESDLFGELGRARPGELLVAPDFPWAERLGHRYPKMLVTIRASGEDNASGRAEQLLTDDDAVDGFPLALAAADTAIAYAQETQPAGQLPLIRLQLYSPTTNLRLDEAAVADLELIETNIGGHAQGSLLHILDKTHTAPGGRLLRNWLLYPLVNKEPIDFRLDAVGFFVNEANVRCRIREQLRGCADIERIAGRITLGNVSPRDLGNLQLALSRIPDLTDSLQPDGHKPPELLDLSTSSRDIAAKLAKILRDTLVETPPAGGRDGGFVREGYSELVDQQRNLASGAKDTIAAIESRERDETGIATLRIKYNRVFGYFLEVSKSHVGRVPDSYVRKQTVANAERFVTPELADLETKIVSAQEKLLALELEIFEKLRTSIAEELEQILTIGHWLARVDVLAALAEVAHHNRYTRPMIDDDLVLDVHQSRHAVVEHNSGLGRFVPNDCRLDPDTDQLLVVTGPNMAGKSTYMRQIAQLVVMAQMGSFVAADSAHVGLCDQLFTRVGAADNLSRGESTFMVEMKETAEILRLASRRSLVILDEVGRGTSTFDGVSIAWAVAEYLHDAIGARALFATHYHELTKLAEERPRIRNVSVAVRRRGDSVVFLRQVVDGGASRSYGIDVAGLARLPSSVIARARQILRELEVGQWNGPDPQLPLFSGPSDDGDIDYSDIVDALRSCDPHETTPLQALALVSELHSLILAKEADLTGTEPPVVAGSLSN